MCDETVKASEEQTQEGTEAKFDGAVADGSSLGSVEVLGGPTPQNSKPDDDSNKLKTPSQTQAASPKTKPSAASSKKAESVEAENADGENLIEIDVSQDVAALTEGEELSEEFKNKAATIFEAAVVSRLNEELERVHEEYAVVAGLKKVFVENHIEVPEEKTDLVHSMASELDSMEAKLNEQIEKNVGLSTSVAGYVKNGIVSEISEGLASTEKEKLASLSEGVEFEDEESFRSKVETLKESYFSSKPAKADVETVAEDVQPVVDSEITESMSRYVDALKRFKA